MDGGYTSEDIGGPCPVCGHPTGDCAGELPPPTHLVGARIFPSPEHEEVFLVEDDVYQERVMNSHTTLRVKVARKGQALPMSRARELGLC